MYIKWYIMIVTLVFRLEEKREGYRERMRYNRWRCDAGYAWSSVETLLKAPVLQVKVSSFY